MKDLLSLIYEYRRLLVKADSAQQHLQPAARKRLAALEQLFGKEPDSQQATPARRHARCSVSMTATVKVKGGNVQPVKLLNIGGGGVCISPAPNLKTGETALLRIVGEHEEQVFQYKVRAGWTWRNEANSQMGMPFIGAPKELSPTSKRADTVY